MKDKKRQNIKRTVNHEELTKILRSIYDILIIISLLLVLILIFN